MSKKAVNEQQLEVASDELHQASLRVKQLSKEVSQGLASKTELEKAISRLKQIADTVKIKQAENKVLSGWRVHKLGESEFPAENSGFSALLVVIALLSLAYLVLI